MPVLGLHCSHEQVHPRALLAAVQQAEAAGFDAAMSSDHFSPWSSRQGHSAFAWSWLGAALQATSLPFGVVNAGQRYHPAIIAQAIATLGAMYPGRFWAALGSGEASNEHITGGRWPRKDVRNARLRECVDIIRALLREEVSHDGLVTVDRATVYTRPDTPPLLVGAAVSEATAAWCAEWADGLITVNAPVETLRRMIGAYRDAGGRGDLALQVHLSWAPDEREAQALAYEQWRSNVFRPPSAGTSTSRRRSTRSARRPARARRAGRQRLGGPRCAHRTARGVRRARLRQDLPASRRSGAGGVRGRLRSEGPPPVAERGMRLTQTSDLWWKNAVVYCLDVETYADGDGDGCGDFRGLIQQIDHLHRLGVTCIWLMPFYPSPDRDDGYDITDFYGVDPRLGTLGEFVEFVRTARDRGIRVIADLVVNHTSIQHPWFQQARSSPDNPYRDWYVWADEPPADGPQGVTFPDKETSLWQFDEEAGQYFLHRFYKFQPDLNVANPAVRDEIARIIGFWMQLGLSGFRVDAVPFLLETSGQADAADLPDPHDYLADLRSFLNRRNGEGVLLGEVNLPYADTMQFFGKGDDELTMCFDFIGMQSMYLSLVRGDAGPIAEALRDRPQPPKDAHWATFVRNHDELTLDKLSEAQRQEIFDAFGPDKDMQVYGRGLRRRLPPMVEGDQRRIRLVYSLLFALPGTPVLFYGEEIGLGENLKAEGRLAVRVPMQWTAEPGGGFSTADPSTFPSRSPRARSGRSTSTSATSPATPTRSCRSSGTSSTPTARARSWRGAPWRWSTRGRRPGRCSRTARTSTASPSSRCTTSRTARSPRPSRSPGSTAATCTTCWPPTDRR